MWLAHARRIAPFNKFGSSSIRFLTSVYFGKRPRLLGHENLCVHIRKAFGWVAILVAFGYLLFTIGAQRREKAKKFQPSCKLCTYTMHNLNSEDWGRKWVWKVGNYIYVWAFHICAHSCNTTHCHRSCWKKHLLNPLYEVRELSSFSLFFLRFYNLKKSI